VHINRILTKFCPMKVRGSGNYETPCIYGGAHATELNHPCAVVMWSMSNYFDHC